METAKTKILYVEDEPFLGRIVKESLESRDFEVNMADDGAKAIDLFRKVSPDICVLDIMLPSKDGYSIAKNIRQVNPNVPIIFVTAKTQTDDLLKGFEAGGNDYLRKPFSMEELIVRVNNLLNLSKKNKPTAMAGVVKLGRFEFDSARYDLRIDGTSRKLSHREAMLLQVLAENRNAVVSRKEVLMRIWGDDSFFNSRNLDVYVTKLRDYLKPDPGVEIITIKGIGYQFVVS
ncbi:MAG TPA: response regulator transcription factor [Cyclobacteriaceae bacterium]|nr:response regulator transcription factor [Cyclobacteriaceae bacterium]